MTFNLTPNEGTEVRINGVSGGKQDIALTSDETTVKVELLKGETTKTYTFTIVRGPVLGSMRVEDEDGLTVAMNPSFEKTKTEYIANIDDSSSYGIWETYVYFSKANETDTVKVTLSKVLVTEMVIIYRKEKKYKRKFLREKPMR